VLRGEAGIGKTALLEYLVESATDCTVVRAVGVESDMELAFASLQQLCGPTLDRLERLPAPQRDAVQVAFGLSVGPAPDRFLVGLAVLNLLSEAADKRPLLCIVDDAQWLDRASALTLAFVARRLLAEPVGMVFAARHSADELQHLPELEVRGLRNGDARALLSSAVRFILDERVRDRIIAETHGNPLALLEMPRGLTAMQLAGGFALGGRQALSGRIEDTFVRRLEVLSDDARRLLLVAAAEPVGDPLLLSRASERLGIAVAAVDEETHGLLSIADRVTFRHPLVRSAMYRSAGVRERRAVHLVLAEVTDRELDPDRRAWHLAAAAAGPDEQVALELERSAGYAQARGGLAAAAAFLQRSVALTQDSMRRADRALAAAQASLQAGAFDAALGLLTTAEAGALDELQRARVDLLRGQIAFASTAGGEAPALLLNAARRLESLDPTLARETYLDAWRAAFFAGRFARAGDLREVSRAARSAPQPSSAPRASDLLLEGFSLLVTDGRAGATSMLRRAASVLAEEEVATAEGLRWGWLGAAAAAVLWDEELWHTVCVRRLQSLRDEGILSVMPLYLNSCGMVTAWRGDFPAAASLIEEAEAIVEATGSRFARLAAVIVAGLRGSEAAAFALIEAVARDASAAGQGVGMQWCQFVSAILHNALGRYEEALADAQQASEQAPELHLAAFALPELIEAATRTGRTRLAADALERLAQATRAGATDWGLGVQARSRALLDDGRGAEASYREAIERLSRTRLRPELARAHLLYGEWLRRENRRLDARAQLRTAYDFFVTIGMEAFAERARAELQATGEKLRKRTAETRDDLTAQERQIAELARDGLSNPDIGARLFLSPKTVEWHLHNVFTKLDIRSRRELSSALPDSASELVSA